MVLHLSYEQILADMVVEVSGISADRHPRQCSDCYLRGIYHVRLCTWHLKIRKKETRVKHVVTGVSVDTQQERTTRKRCVERCRECNAIAHVTDREWTIVL